MYCFPTKRVLLPSQKRVLLPSKRVTPSKREVTPRYVSYYESNYESNVVVHVSRDVRRSAKRIPDPCYVEAFSQVWTLPTVTVS